MRCAGLCEAVKSYRDDEVWAVDVALAVLRNDVELLKCVTCHTAKIRSFIIVGKRAK